MNETIIFLDKASKPTEQDLQKALGKTYAFWQKIHGFVLTKYPNGLAEWFYSSKKRGWSYRIKETKRAIINFMPRDKYFKVSFAFGQKATDKILESTISSKIQNELKEAKVYAEGRGIQIVVDRDEIIGDIQQLIEIKLNN